MSSESSPSTFILEGLDSNGKTISRVVSAESEDQAKSDAVEFGDIHEVTDCSELVQDEVVEPIPTTLGENPDAEDEAAIEAARAEAEAEDAARAEADAAAAAQAEADAAKADNKNKKG